MAAATAILPNSRFTWDAGIADHNARLLALQQQKRRGPTPEFFFTRHFDNSRLQKTADPARVREMRIFIAALTLLFSLAMIYGLQHFSAIERSYRVEAEKQVRDQLREDNRQLRLSEAQLTEPGRIDGMARKLGMSEPHPGQVIHPTAPPDPATPTLAQATPPAPVQ